MAFEVTTGTARISYEHLLKPYSFSADQPQKYSCTVLVPKTDTKTVEALKKAIEAATSEGVSKKWDGKKPARVATPLHDGDEPRPSDGESYGPECKGCYLFTASASEENKPPVVDNHCDPIMDATQVYSGMYARVCVAFYPYSSNGKKGIGCGLKAVQKVKDGEPLGGGKVNVNKVFTSFDVDPITGEIKEA